MPSLRVVLDTNVWLDWLVFDDPSVEAIREAQRLAEVDIVIDDGCTAELQRVLAYPALALDDARQRDCLDRLRACTSRHDGHLAPGCTALPRCRDGDDQKFLELACNAGARWLLTRDKALLSVSRSRLAQAGFRVGTPLEFALSRCPGKAASG
jgi:uncharacterized protein